MAGTNYTIVTPNGSFVIAGETIDTTSTSLTLVGRNISGYGEYISQSLVDIHTHNARKPRPSNPMKGEMWFDTSANRLYVYVGTSPSVPTGWMYVNAATSSGSTAMMLHSSLGDFGGDYYLDLANSTGSLPVARLNGTYNISITGNAATATNANLATYATNAGNAANAGVANNVSWPGVTGKPTTISGFGITDAYTKTETDQLDFLNLNPKAGLLPTECTVPVYSDFKFSLGAFSSSAFSFTDKDSKQVIFFAATTPTGVVSTYRAFRFSDNDSFIFDNNPVSATFLTATERVSHIVNMGTFFAVLWIVNASGGFVRAVMVKTQGSSKWQDWTYAYDVSSLLNSTSNVYLLQDDTGDFILQTTYSGSASAVLNVYSSTLTLLRSLTFYNSSIDLNSTDTTSDGRTGGAIALGYNPLSLAFPFTWNPFTETFYQKNSGWYSCTNSSGVVQAIGYSMTFSWHIPRSWIVSGTGTCTNLIPIKSNTYRYNKYPDATWNTEDGGMSTTYGNSGNSNTILTDEFTKNMYLGIHSTWDSTSTGSIYRIDYSNGKEYKTLGGSYLANYITNSSGSALPDGSAWSKSLSGQWVQIIGNTISFAAYSSKYGNAHITTTFDTSSFTSAVYPNDTLKLDAANAVIHAESTWPSVIKTLASPGSFGTVVVSGTPTYYWAYPGQTVYTASVSGPTKTWTATSLSVPSVPSTIGSVSTLTFAGDIAWNGSTSNPIFWMTVKTSINYAYVAKYVTNTNTWTISSRVFQSQTDAGNANRGDTSNSFVSNRSQHVLTENGRWIFQFSVGYIGGAAAYDATYNVNTDVMTVSSSSSKFPSVQTSNTPPHYRPGSGYFGASFGYNQYFGYFALYESAYSDSLRIMSSKDIRGVGIPLTEDQWYNGTSPAYETYVSAESATGLVAYLASYPIFIGGYYTSVPTTSVNLSANTTNYVYAVKSPSDRTTVLISNSTYKLPTSFSRVLLAKIVTNATNVVSMTTYPYDGLGLPERQGNASKALMTDGLNLYWGNAQGAQGGGNDRIFYENDQVVTADYSITPGKNAMSAGPITVSNGVTVTIPNGSTWTIV